MTAFTNDKTITFETNGNEPRASHDFHGEFKLNAHILGSDAEEYLLGAIAQPVFTDTEISSYAGRLPALTLDEWLEVLFNFQPDDEGDKVVLEGWIWEIYYDREEDRKDVESMQNIWRLTHSEKAFIERIAHKVLADEIQDLDSFREAIGILSNTSRHCVFSDDPTVEKCWKLVSIEQIGETYGVYWQFAGNATTFVNLAYSSDNTLVATNAILEWNSQMWPDGENLGSFLARKSIVAVQAMMDNQCEVTI